MRRVRTFLCHGARNLEIAEGESVLVGRAAHCDAVLDDELASREHLRISLQGGRLTLTDLRSRNGVLVNGDPISATHELHHGDHITAGRTPLTIVQTIHEPRSRPPTGPVLGGVGSDEHTSAGNLFDLLEGSARVALQADELSSAEASARSLMTAMRGWFLRGREVDPAWLSSSVSLAVDLAAASRDATWLDRALELQTTSGVPMRISQSQCVVALARELPVSESALRAYLQMATSDPSDGSAECLAALLQDVADGD